MKTMMVLVVAVLLGMSACSSDEPVNYTARDVATGYCDMLQRCGTTDWPSCADDILASNLLSIDSLPQEKLAACVGEYQSLQCGGTLTQFCVGELAGE